MVVLQFRATSCKFTTTHYRLGRQFEGGQVILLLQLPILKSKESKRVRPTCSGIGHGTSMGQESSVLSAT